MPDYRVIPSIDQLRQRPGVRALDERHGADATVAALRQAADAVRRALQDGEAMAADEAAARIEYGAGAALEQQARGTLRPVLNATGVIIHTNLGRSPLAPAAMARVAAIGAGYATLEYDLPRGARGLRHAHADALLRTLSGAEAAVVVNNNAAAMLLVLAALARGREVVISRGELVEIGGGFRVPDVMMQSGARLREVGTTNRTRLSDYTAALQDQTAMVLRVHRSNFRIEGFTEQPSLPDLVAACRARSVLIVEDLGSGSLLPDLAGEPSVMASVAAGVDLVCFSGDKMLGGPQAGIIVGREASVALLRRHPLMRALRVDKLTLAALEGTLLEYVAGRAEQTVPAVRMIRLAAAAVEARARRLADRLTTQGWHVEILPGASTIGGGSAPGIELATTLIAVTHQTLGADALASRMRALDPPLIARIENDRVVLDLRTIDETDDDRLAELMAGM